MTTLYWQVAPALDQRRRQAEQMLARLEQAPTPSPRQSPDHSPAEKPRPWQPAAALRDLGDRYELQFQLPGVDLATLDVQATRSRVTVAGDRLATEGPVIHSEFQSGAFERSLRFPEALQHQAVTAEYSHGLLTLTLPKLAAAPDYQVQIPVNLIESTSLVADSGQVNRTTPKTDSIASSAAVDGTGLPEDRLPEEDIWAD